VMSDWQGNPIDAETATKEGGQVLALGDAARLEEVLEAMGSSELSANVKPSSEPFIIPPRK